MTTGSSVKSVAACFGLAAFAVATVSGLAAGRTLQEILGGAIASLFVCFLIGMVIGVVGDRALREVVSRYTEPGAEAGGPRATNEDAGETPIKGSPA